MGHCTDDGRKPRPDSLISDTSSDYDSNIGSRRPQSFLLDDEHDIITEEESEKQQNQEFEASSSSESEEADTKEIFGKKTKLEV